MVEAKFHEEKLKLQQQHDVAVQKVGILLLNWKNWIDVQMNDGWMDDYN